MMIHDKILSGQFLFDFKNDRTASALMHHSHHHSQFHAQQHISHQHQQQQLPSPPMSNIKMDLYSAYAYQQQLQQQLIGQTHNALQQQQQRQSPLTPAPEVLDLSRRCDSVETTRKTPSPYHTNSSFGTNSPAGSPTNSNILNMTAQTTPTPPLAAAATAAAAAMIPANLLYSAQTQAQPNALASLYPALYYPGAIKQEHIGTTQQALAPVPTAATSPTPLPAAASSLLQTFATAAAAAALNANEEQFSPSSHTSNHNNNTKYTSPIATPTPITSPTSSTTTTSTALATLDKTTRPFKAFPRDPLVIAANFAANDVLLDNPRVERYTEYRKRVLEQIRNSNGGSRTVTNPKMRRTNARSGSVPYEAAHYFSHANSENDEQRSTAAEESSDCDSNAGNFDKIMTTSTSSTSSISSNECNNNNNDNQTNPNSSMLSQTKDAAYYERRRKNNAAAKKSRDRRRIKEDEIAIRAAYLERQNIELLCQIDALKAQLSVFTSKVGA